MNNDNTFFYQKISGLDIMVKRAVLESVETINGFDSIVVLDKYGYRCGYIGVDTSLPVFDLIKDDLNLIESHGNTFCFFNPDFDAAIDSDNEKYWVGYDCNHSFDGKDFDSVEKYFGKSVRETQENISGYFYDYAQNEAVSLENCKLINRSMAYDINELVKEVSGKDYKTLIDKAHKKNIKQMER